MSDRFVLVLAGGRGERFWPWSRPERPKQLLPLAKDGRTLLAATLERALEVASPRRILVLTSADLRGPVSDACRASGVRVVGEPVMRNTAAAIAAAALRFQAEASDPVFAVFPADHAIDDRAAFRADLERACGLAEREDVLVTFGIVPASPDTSFGYIGRGARVADRVARVARFTEKPDRERATAWVADGYLWNSGIFVWRTSTFLAALEAGRPALARGAAALAGATSDAELEQKMADAFPGLESISVDYAVLEKASNVLVIEAAFDWDDLGSWGAWARRQSKDASGNVLFGDAVAIDCERCVVVGEDGTAAALGLRDMVVVRAGGATLACRLEDSDGVRRVAEAVRARGGA